MIAVSTEVVSRASWAASASPSASGRERCNGRNNGPFSKKYPPRLRRKSYRSAWRMSARSLSIVRSLASISAARRRRVQIPGCAEIVWTMRKTRPSRFVSSRRDSELE